jgi:hypothetical protein
VDVISRRITKKDKVTQRLFKKYFTLQNQKFIMNQKTKTTYSRLKEEPLLKFLLISIGIYMLYGFYGVKDADTLAKENTITITTQQIDLMAFGFQQRLNRKPTDEELQKLIDTRVKETVLFEEAKKMGLDKDDVVIIRRVVLQYRNLIQGLLVPPDPTDEELNAYYQENIDVYIPDERISFTQIFFDPDKRDESTLDDAEKALVKLQNMETIPNDLTAYGDNFMLANTYRNITSLELRKYFGSGFENSVLQLEPNIWVGPVLSGYGTHLVFVSNKQVAEPLPLIEVKERVLVDYMDKKNQELVKLYMKSVLDKYDVVIIKDKTVKK